MPPRFSSHQRRHAGLSLIELLVVLGVLIALAGIVVPMLSDFKIGPEGERKTPQQIATEQTLMQVRTAILGGDGKKGLWRDLGERQDDLPRTIAELFVPRVGWSNYDPNTGIGWRGPYLLSDGARYGTNDSYGTATDSAVMDAWGRPIVIQAPDANSIRLVSSGVDGVIRTPPAVAIPALAACGDDMVLFLRVADSRL